MNKWAITTNEQNENNANEIKYLCCAALLKSYTNNLLGGEKKKCLSLLRKALHIEGECSCFFSDQLLKAYSVFLLRIILRSTLSLWLHFSVCWLKQLYFHADFLPNQLDTLYCILCLPHSSCWKVFVGLYFNSAFFSVIKGPKFENKPSC